MGTSVSKLDHVVGKGGRTFPNQRQDFGLRGCFSRHRAMESIWSIVSLFGLSSDDHYIAVTTRSLATELASLAKKDDADREPGSVEKIHSCIDSLETELRSIVREIPLERMRAELPAQVHKDRRGVIDLMDLMLGAETESTGEGCHRAKTLDYVITVLCTDGGRSSEILDPLTLSPLLYGLCEIASEQDDPKIAEFAGKLMSATDDAKSANLTQLKSELGELMFVPDVLRTLVAYNAALWDDGNPTRTPSEPCSIDEEVETPQGQTTIFVTTVLPKIAEGLRRRAAGEDQTTSAFDRISWSLELDYPTPEELAALLSPSVGRKAEVAGTTVLIGLLCKAATVIAEDLDSVGIDESQLAGEWTRELNDLIKRDVAQMIGSDGYEEACALSDLRTKYLYLGMNGVEREPRRAPAVQSPKEQFSAVRDQVTELASEAAVSNPPPAPVQTSEANNSMRKTMLLHGGSSLLALIAAAGMLFAVFYRPDGLEKVSPEQLAQVSPYLMSGRDSATGDGSSFVGIIHPDWSQLELEIQEVLAQEMVDALRTTGIRQIMIYDGANQLRVQALGGQSPRLMGESATASPSDS